MEICIKVCIKRAKAVKNSLVQPKVVELNAMDGLITEKNFVINGKEEMNIIQSF